MVNKALFCRFRFVQELKAALAVFLSIAYIPAVNANMFSDPLGDGSDPLGVSFGAIYIATALAAVFSNLIMGLYARLPLAMASGMGFNAFFVYTVCLEQGFSYANALVLILADGLVFTILTLTGLKDRLLEAIPCQIKSVLGCALGLMLALIGLMNGGLLLADSCKGISFRALSMYVPWNEVMPGITCIFAVLVTVILYIKNSRAPILWGIIAGTILYYLLGLTVPGFYNQISLPAISDNFADFFSQAFGAVFSKGFDFSGFLKTHTQAELVIGLLSSGFAFLVMDVFDAAGTIMGLQKLPALADKSEKQLGRAFVSDAAATAVGSVFGASTITILVESAVGAEGEKRTGVTAIIAACLFVPAVFFSSFSQLLPSCATSAALIFVGFLMMKSTAGMRGSFSIPAFVTACCTGFSMNVSWGIAYGFLTCTAMELAEKRKIRASAALLSVLFLLLLLFTG